MLSFIFGHLFFLYSFPYGISFYFVSSNHTFRNLTNLPLTVEIVKDNGTDTRYVTKDLNCLYHGYVHGIENSIVALSWCTSEEMVKKCTYVDIDLIYNYYLMRNCW